MKKYSWWEDVPNGLYSKTALGRMGLKPKGEPVAQVFQRLGRTWIDLYTKDQACPKKPISEKQKEALKKARKAYEEKYCCQRCGCFSKSPIVDGYCKRCRRHLELFSQ